MARPRTPLAKAEATGRTIHDPQRFRDRTEPLSGPLGEPSRHLYLNELEAWETHKRMFPYLTERDRGFADCGAILLGKLLSRVRERNVVKDYQAWCSQAGGSPTSASKVHVPEAKEDDPANEFLN